MSTGVERGAEQIVERAQTREQGFPSVPSEITNKIGSPNLTISVSGSKEYDSKISQKHS